MRYRLRKKYNEYKEHSSGILVNRIGEVLNRSITKNGKYLSVSKNKKNYLVHRLVLETFKPLESYSFNITVDHINNKKHDNRLRNLRWLERGENARLGNLGDKNNNRKDMLNYTPKCGVPVIGKNKITGDILEFPSIQEAERFTGIKNGINSVLHRGRKTSGGFYWKYKIM